MDSTTQAPSRACPPLPAGSVCSGLWWKGGSVVVLLGAPFLAGCYEHVVEVHGPSSRNIQVHEPSIGRGESFWSQEQPRPVDPDRYTVPTSLDRARPVPKKTRTGN